MCEDTVPCDKANIPRRWPNDIDARAIIPFDETKLESGIDGSRIRERTWTREHRIKTLDTGNSGVLNVFVVLVPRSGEWTVRREKQNATNNRAALAKVLSH